MLVRMLFAAFPSYIAEYYFGKALLGIRNGKKSTYVWAFYLFYRVCYQQLVLAYRGDFAEGHWNLLTDLLIQVIGLFIYTIVLWYVFQGNLIKIVIVSFVVETLTALVILGSQYIVLLSGVDQQNIIISNIISFIITSLLLFFAYKILYIQMIKMQNYQIKHIRFWGIIAMFQYILSIFGNTRIGKRDVALYMSISQIVFISGILIVMIFVVYFMIIFLRRNKQKTVMESRLIKMKEQEVFYSQKEKILMDQSQRIHKTLDKLSDENLTEDREKLLNQYIQGLKEEFAQIEKGFYCKDPKMDIFLYSLVKEFEKHDISSEIHFQGYQGKNIPVEDVETMLWNMLPSMIVLMEISSQRKFVLRAADQGNQLILWITMQMEIRQDSAVTKSIKQCKKKAKAFLRRYHGILIEEIGENKIEIRMMLEKE